VKKLLKWVVVLGVLFGLVSIASVRAKTWMAQRAIPKYLTASISRGQVWTVVTSTGTVKPVLSVSVGAFTSGPIAKVNVDFNSAVKKGEILALIDPRLAQAAYDHDVAALEAQQADLGRVDALVQQAKNNEARARKLVAINKDYIADTDLDTYLYTRMQYEAQYRLGQASIKQAEAQVANSKANLEYTKIISPVDGVIINRLVDPGQTVAASFQTPELFVIAPDMEKHMYIYASVDEADIGQIRAAQAHDKAVQFTVDAYPGDLFKGKIHQVRHNSTTTQNVVTYPVVIEVPNPGLKLMPGMTANLTFPIETKEDVLRLPSTALRFVPLTTQVHPEDQHYLESPQSTQSTDVKKRSADEKAEQARKRQQRIVWVKDGELLRAVPVTLGLIENKYAEVVLGNLTEGQEVIVGIESGASPR
jgi:HlyD family secretion protein